MCEFCYLCHICYCHLFLYALGCVSRKCCTTQRMSRYLHDTATMPGGGCPSGLVVPSSAGRSVFIHQRAVPCSGGGRFPTCGTCGTWGTYRHMHYLHGKSWEHMKTCACPCPQPSADVFRFISTLNLGTGAWQPGAL